MKVGYPDTMNSAAAASPMKARYASSGELDDLQTVKVEPGAFSGDGNKDEDDSPATYRKTPINMKTPVKARSRKSGDINYKKADRLNKRVGRLEKRLEKSGIKKAKGGSYTGNEGYVGDSRREIRVRKQDRKAGAAAGYGNMDEAKSTAKLDKKLAKKGFKRIDYGGKDDKFDPKKSPTKFASNAQRKAVWASKNEKKKNK